VLFFAGLLLFWKVVELFSSEQSNEQSAVCLCNGVSIVIQFVLL